VTKLFGPFRLNGSSIHPLHPVLSKDHQVKETRCTQHVAAAAKSKKKKKQFILSISLRNSTSFFSEALLRVTRFCIIKSIPYRFQKKRVYHTVAPVRSRSHLPDDKNKRSKNRNICIIYSFTPYAGHELPTEYMPTQPRPI
jgi:hypothetical protein